MTLASSYHCLRHEKKKLTIVSNLKVRVYVPNILLGTLVLYIKVVAGYACSQSVGLAWWAIY